VRKYHAKIYDDAQEWVSEQVLADHITRGAQIGNSENFAQGEKYPEDIEYLIRSQAELDEYFEEFPVNVNFDREMVAICFFTCRYISKDYKIESIEVDEGELEIDVEYEKESRGCGKAKLAPFPRQRCIAVKMDKVDVYTVDFSL
jgi:hypothetical protein